MLPDRLLIIQSQWLSLDFSVMPMTNSFRELIDYLA